jgi:hypothetical protein
LWLERGRKCELTEVVLTPQSSNFAIVEVGAFGVSMNSKSDSLPFKLWGFDILNVSFQQQTFLKELFLGKSARYETWSSD